MSRRPLARHVTVILLVKLWALVAIYAACFAPPHQPAVSDRAVADRLFGPGPLHRPEAAP